MGIDITIGNAVPDMPNLAEDSEYRSPRWTVEGGESPDAPSFPGDGPAQSTRSASYSAWADFCRQTGLVDLLGHRSTLVPEHPGVALLTSADHDEVRAALERWATRPWPTTERIAGFDPHYHWTTPGEPDPRYDYILARLIWLEFWIGWALKNCEFPALGNS